MITVKNDDTKETIYDDMKRFWRRSTITIAAPNLSKLINENLPDNTINIAEDFDEEGFEVRHQLKIENDKIQISLKYFVETPATKEEIEEEIKIDAKQKIETLKMNLNLLCDKYNISMDDLMEMVSKK